MSLSRPFPTQVAANNPSPAQLYTTRVERGPDAGSVVDYVGINCHGTASTHIDALCHCWDEDGMWNGRDPDEEIQHDGVRFGDVAAFGDGIVTRGVLLDVPRHRGVPYVTQDEPVTGEELVGDRRGDGRRARAGRRRRRLLGSRELGRGEPAVGTGSLDVGTSARPGLHVSCLPFLRDSDAAVLVWDMMDLRPNGFELAFAVHAAIWAFGIALVDNALLEPLAGACAEEGRSEFQLCVAPLPIAGGTGSSVNPIALF